MHRYHPLGDLMDARGAVVVQIDEEKRQYPEKVGVFETCQRACTHEGCSTLTAEPTRRQIAGLIDSLRGDARTLRPLSWPLSGSWRAALASSLGSNVMELGLGLPALASGIQVQPGASCRPVSSVAMKYLTCRSLILLCHKFNLGLVLWQWQCGQCPRALASATLRRRRSVVIESGT